MKKESYYCDVCGSDIKEQDKKSIQVIFTTEQTEGRCVDHHLSIESIHICAKCLRHIVSGNYLYGSGAQGFNKYWFKVKPDPCEGSE